MEKIQEISLGECRELKDGKVDIPTHMLDRLNLRDGDRLVVIFIPERNQLRVMKVEEELQKLTVSCKDIYETTSGITQKLVKAKVNIVHTTGFCFVEGKCIWEGFLSETEEGTLENMINEIRKMENVYNVDLKKV